MAITDKVDHINGNPAVTRGSPHQDHRLAPNQHQSTRLTRKFCSEGNLQASGDRARRHGAATLRPDASANDGLLAQAPLLGADELARPSNGAFEPRARPSSAILIDTLSNTGDHHGNRQAYNLPEFNEQYEVIKGGHRGSSKVGNKFIQFIKPHFSLDSINHKMVKLFPILAWLRNYNVRKNLIVDLIAGLTILVFQVPQSMGYSLIARVPPVHGLYTSFFPALVYSFMGTSRHCAVGTFAVVSLMTGSLVAQVLESQGVRTADRSSEAVEIAMAISFLIGMYQLAFGILRLGFFSVYMSEQLISGFTTACSFYVFTSQISYLFGLHLPYRSGPLALLYTYKDLVLEFDHINLPTVTISVSCCLVIMIFKFFVNPIMAKKSRLNIPFPIELILVIVSTIASHLLQVRENWNVQVVGSIPRGLPLPRLPKFDLIRELAITTIPLAIVAYTLTISVGKIFASRHKYKVDPNQELLALGVTNIISCFFSCIPSAASLSRSAVQESSGGRTQLVSLVNCVGLLFVLLFAGPLLSELPNCVLAAIIAVALKTLLAQVKDFANYWKVSKLDGSIWLITFFAVLLLDVDIGLYVGLGYSLLTLIYKSQRPKMYLLGFVNNSDVYVPVNRYASANEIPGLKIYQFCGPLHFANVEYFQKGVTRKTGVSAKFVLSQREKQRRCEGRKATITSNNNDLDGNGESESLGGDDSMMNCVTLNPLALSHIIIDCSMFSYIDVAGVRQLRSTIQEYSHIGVETFLACVATHVYKMMEKDGFFLDIPPSHVYLTIHDAVDVALKDRRQRFKSLKGSQSISINDTSSCCSTLALNAGDGGGTVDSKTNVHHRCSSSSHQLTNQQQQHLASPQSDHHKHSHSNHDEKFTHEDDLSENSKFLCCPKTHSP